MTVKRPVWQRTWYVLTAMFAISLLVTCLQWNTGTLTPRPASRPVPNQYIPGVPSCFASGELHLLSECSRDLVS
jgi:hypothetical protein